MLKTLVTKGSADYTLLDSGEGEKLERFGDVVLSRPDPQALWHKHLPESEWKKAHGNFTREKAKDREIGRAGQWEFKTVNGKSTEKSWPISHGGLKFLIKPTAFKHTGLFPEQAPNWDWTREIIEKAVKQKQPVEVLNLFGYTGGASLACAQAGAKVVHVDGSKSAITWARENAELSGLAGAPIRWILEDARAFVEREIKRGRTYQGIIMDPPAFGHGPDNELWKIEEDFLPLVDMCMKLLAPDALFILINGYSAGYSPIAYQNNLIPLQKERGGDIEVGELVIEEKINTASHVLTPRLLPAGIFARWKK